MRAAECPPLSVIVEELRRRAELARRAVTHRRGRRVVDVNPLIDETRRVYGALQTIDMEYRVSEERVLGGMMRTVPALIACMHMHYYRRGYLNNEVAALVGPGGRGKSTLAFYIATMLGGVILTAEDDIPTVMKRIVEIGEWKPIIVLDDIGAIISKYWHMDREERRRWTPFFRALEYLKDVTGLLLLTARTPESIARRLREMVTLLGHVHRAIVSQTYVIDYVVWVNTATREPVYIDVLWPGARMPRDAWDEIMRRRRQELLRLLGSS